MNIYKAAEVVGTILISFIFFTLFLSTLLFFVGISITTLTIFISLLLSLFIGWIMGKNRLNTMPYKVFTISCLLSVISIIFFTYVSGKMLDITWDGQSYHKPAILFFEKGWNPFYDFLGKDVINHIWINHYAKGPWIFSSTLMSITGIIEQGKSINLLLIFSAFLFSLSAFYKITKNHVYSFIFALFVALNPVSVNQASSFYVDGQIGSLITCLVALSILLYHEYNKLYLLLFCFCLTLLINVKFTGLVYAVILSIGLIALLFFTNKTKLKKIIPILLITGIIGSFVVGYNPYVTNMLSKGHPFHPLAGKETVDIMTGNSPVDLYENRLASLYQSVFSYSSNYRVKPEMKIPFTIHRSEIDAFRGVDTRIGGFGPLFGGIIIITLLSLLFLIRNMHKKVIPYFIILSVILVSIFINPEPWWARYIPQLWIVPILVLSLCVSGLYKLNKTVKWIAIPLILSLYTINIVFTTGAHYLFVYESSQTLNQQLKILRDHSIEEPLKVSLQRFKYSTERRLSEGEVNYNHGDIEGCSYKVTLLGTTPDDQICIQNQEVYNDFINISKD
ncbi:hypothetical protein LC087_11705 [Bacillus carboniphilus]|uniref:Glycosyltransferase RgtA/B/C/D-like domain-containing protein n=1 Tax=Bacillus carboniphilus TaxID=86663 RepID=A0ABY9JV45_9BACI|nr:hypothetical protein [Bacillus carboniphilus]WLR41551.1 hypothetical protein LC087_11705 [Bacillus carboniphilus]